MSAIESYIHQMQTLRQLVPSLTAGLALVGASTPVSPVDCKLSGEHERLSNTCPPAGFYCPAGCGPCSCGSDGMGLHSCGSLCCAHSPTPADGSNPCYVPCPNGLTSYGNGVAWNECHKPWGIAFLFVALTSVAVYVGGGFAVARAQGSTGHPHQHKWRELQGLVADGIAFIRHAQRRRHLYTNVPESNGAEQTSSISGRSQTGQPQPQKKRARHAKSPNSRERSSIDKRANERAHAAEQQQAGEAPGERGGRWVHVPA